MITVSLCLCWVGAAALSFRLLTEFCSIVVSESFLHLLKLALCSQKRTHSLFCLPSNELTIFEPRSLYLKSQHTAPRHMRWVRTWGRQGNRKSPFAWDTYGYSSPPNTEGYSSPFAGNTEGYSSPLPWNTEGYSRQPQVLAGGFMPPRRLSAICAVFPASPGD